MEGRHPDLSTVLQLLQIVIIAIGLAGVFVRVGEYQANQIYNTGQLQDLK